MLVVAPRAWLFGAVGLSLLASLCVLGFSGLSVPVALLAALAVLALPPALSQRFFALVENLGRATGRTRAAVAGGWIAETTTTRLGLWLASASNLALCALGVLGALVGSGAL
jgi:hypothetical protein